jgi:phenylalanyl-tRNA synthetase alpha chain
MSDSTSLTEQLEATQQRAIADFSQAKNLKELDALRTQYLGKKGVLTDVLKGVGRLAPAERPLIGQQVNSVKAALNEALSTTTELLQQQERQQRIEAERLDITLPGRRQSMGARHPIQQGLDEISDIFSRMGFTIAQGPEMEDEFHNFDALNIPPEHPARAMHDTFFLQSDDDVSRLLRTHTSPVQIRAMLKHIKDHGESPLAVVAPGRVFRCDHDVTHSPMFHQVEVFKVGEDVSMAHLKGVLQYFLSHYFNQDLPIRLRPSYFPFTEPSAEVDMGCVMCQGKGCRVCKNTGWLEVLGSGMIHPNVLKSVGLDSERWSGFAFGLGVERLVMLKYGIPDLRLFFENDARFLRRIGA